MNKENSIVETTLRLITSQGFHGSPMSQIAKEAGVAAGTIYHYFNNKNDLIRKVYKNVKKEMGEALMESYQEGLDYRIQFGKFWHGLFVFFINNPLKFQFLEQFHHSPFISEETQNESQVFYQPVLDFFQKGIQAGYLREMELELISSIIYGNIVSVCNLHLNNELYINEKREKAAINASWDSIKNENIKQDKYE